MSRTPHTEPEHPSQLAFDRLLAGESEDMEPVRAHLAACDQCRERYEALAAEQQAHMSEAHVTERVDALMTALTRQSGERETAGRAAGAEPDTGPRWRLPWQRWMPLAAAAALAFLVLWPRGTDPDSGTTRAAGLKDPPALQVLVAEPGGVSRPLRPDEPVPRDTTLRFRAGCDRHCIVLLAAIHQTEGQTEGQTGDQTGPVQLVEQHDAPAPWKLAPGEWNLLPVGLALDDTTRLAALFCEAKPEREAFIELLARHHAAHPRDLGAALPAAPPGCVLRSVLVSARP